ncbi:MAG: polyphosphate kinase 1 [Candidatus Promineifilaceae bacterium]
MDETNNLNENETATDELTVFEEAANALESAEGDSEKPNTPPPTPKTNKAKVTPPASEVKAPAPEPPPVEPTKKTRSKPIDLFSPSYYINRELSQIEFNRRVLDESMNLRHPLLERAKFIAIFASNMDEFFMVRVSGLKQLVALGITDAPPDGLSPREQLVATHRIVTQLVQTEMQNWQQIESDLRDAGITIRDYSELKGSRKRKLRQYFEQEIFPTLTPLAFDPSHPFPHISNLSLNLAVVIRDPDTHATHFARVKVPDTLPRLVPLRKVAPDTLQLPTSPKFVWVEQLIKANLNRLFPGMEIVDAYPFRVTRNNDMEIQEDEADDLLMTIEQSIRERHFGNVVRFEVDSSMPDSILHMLMENFEVGQHDVYSVDGPLALSSLWELLGIERSDLKDEVHRPQRPVPFQTGENVFQVLRRQPVLIHRPYDSFRDVSGFVNTAADDPDVLTIKMTLYRVGRNSEIVEALMRARENGKQVAVLVELKARFDEASNISWARALEKAGIHVVYGVLGFKTHAKVCLVVRRERTGLRRYLHLSTGNYNGSTARLYTDLDMMTSDEAMGTDASDVFNFLTGFSKQREYNKFLVAPFSLRPKLLELIANEAALGDKGYIVMKINSLVDAQCIRALYRASQAGVKVELIVRGTCCLRPGLPKVSENIRVISIVGRFLEHSRVFYFGNDDNPVLYMGSADLMPRNLDRRIEVVFPVEDRILQREVYENILQIQLDDTQQSYTLQSDGSYQHSSVTTPLLGETLFSSQKWHIEERITLQQPTMPDVG